MQIRPKTYLHFIALWRSLRDSISPHHDTAPQETSPLLIFSVVMLALLLAILEADVHRGELASLGLTTGDYPIQAAFLSP